MNQEPNNPEITIKDEAQFDRIIKDRQEKNKKRIVNPDLMKRDAPRVEHKEMANLLIKVINVIKMDPTIKKVLTMRVMGPMITGHEKTHLSIALELGINEEEIVQIEQAGMVIVNKYLEKVDPMDSMQSFNRDRIVEREVKKLKNKMKDNG